MLVPKTMSTSNMAYSPQATPGKKRRIDSLATNTAGGNEPPQWSPNGPLSANTNTDINTPYQPLTPDRTPARAPRPQPGLFSKQARAQRNGVPAALQPPPPDLDPQGKHHLHLILTLQATNPSQPTSQPPSPKPNPSSPTSTPSSSAP